MLETRDVPGATELEAPSHRPPIRGVNETPHSTSPKPAVRIVLKLSPVAGRAHLPSRASLADMRRPESAFGLITLWNISRAA